MASVPAPVALPAPLPADPLRMPLPAHPVGLQDRLRPRAPVPSGPTGWAGPVPPPVPNGVDAEIERVAAGIEEASAYLHRLLAARDGG